MTAQLHLIMELVSTSQSYAALFASSNIGCMAGLLDVASNLAMQPSGQAAAR